MIQKLKNIYHLFQAITANFLYGFPSRRLKVIGVTGTDGKTTTTSIIYHILRSSGKKVSMISSVYAKIGNEEHDIGFHVTSPDRSDVQRYLKQSADNGDEFFILEVTSHGIDQYRVWGIEFDIGVLTNVSHEHLDYHKHYKAYVRVKSKLLEMAHIAITNADDQSHPLLEQYVSAPLITYALRKDADYKIDIAKKLGITLPEFNNYNCLAAYAVCRRLGISEKEILEALKTYKLPDGRIEVVTKKPVMAIVDFAHTPNSVDKILQYVRQQVPDGRIIHVFGSAAQRDESKRPIMGSASGRWADLVILTEEDCRTEDPEKICREIAVGLREKGFKKVSAAKFGSSDHQFAVIIDRGEAVKKAVEVAKKGDVIILTGKGHEQTLCRGTKEHPWSDKEALLEAFNQKK